MGRTGSSPSSRSEAWAAAAQSPLSRRTLHQPAAGPPPRDELVEEFAGAAVRLAGVAGLAFGWSPETFWNATPIELTALVRALNGGKAAPPGRIEIARLKELFPDG